MLSPDRVLSYWCHEVGPEGWYKGSAALDRDIREKFGESWAQATASGLRSWMCSASGALALTIVLDQFPRNMFRETGRAFASDRQAQQVAKAAIARGWDLAVPEPERQFFYLPLMHSENQADQDRAVRLILTRLKDGGGNLLHARAHREVIRRFGRFPYRNEALSRATTVPEAAFVAAGGYSALVREMRA